MLLSRFNRDQTIAACAVGVSLRSSRIKFVARGKVNTDVAMYRITLFCLSKCHSSCEADMAAAKRILSQHQDVVWWGGAIPLSPQKALFAVACQH